MTRNGAPGSIRAQRYRHADGVVAAGPLDLPHRRRIVSAYPDAFPTLFDDGCDVTESCEGCPLRVCRFDDASWFRRAQRSARELLINQVLAGNGRNYDLTARQLGITVSMVKLAQKRATKGKHDLSDAEVRALAPLVVTDGPATKGKVHVPRQLGLL